MGKKAPAPPPAPDYAAAAKQTAAGNLDMLKYQTEANRINQYTPWGSLTYERTPAAQVFDEDAYNKAVAEWNKNTGTTRTWVPGETFGSGDNWNYTPGYWKETPTALDPSTAPKREDFMKSGEAGWQQRVTLDPRLQAALDSQLALQTGLSNTANSMLGRVQDAYSTPFNPASWQSFMEGVNPVNQNQVGTLGQFNSSAAINTDLQGFLGQQGVLGLNQSFDRFGYNGPQVQANAPGFNFTGPGVNTQFANFNNTAPAVNNQFANFNYTGPQLQTTGPTFDRSGLPQVNTNFGNFNYTGPGLSTDYARFNNAGVKDQIQDIAGFNPQSILSSMGMYAGEGEGIKGLNQDFGRFEYSGPALNTSQMSFNNYDAQGLMQGRIDPTKYLQNVQDVNQDVFSVLNQMGVQRTNQNAPVFDEEMLNKYAKAAYEAQMALQRDDLRMNEERLRNSLALQGLTPGTEASNNALLSFENARANQLNQLSNQSILTGAEIANKNYGSMLAGLDAQNRAQNQAFSQALGVFGASNDARMQALQQGLGRFGADVTATDSANKWRDMAFQQAATRNNFNLNAQQVANAARDSAFNQALASFGANQNSLVLENQARQGVFDQALAGYGANLQGIQLANQARNTQFGQALARQQFNQGAQDAENAARNLLYGQQANTFGLNQQAQRYGNEAQQQAFNQGLLGFGADLQSAQFNNDARNLLYGQQANTFGLNQQAQRYGNEAQNQIFNQLLAGYGANQQAQVLGNQAQNQMFGQALSGYDANLRGMDFNNNAANMLFNQVLSGYNANQQAGLNENAARTQALLNALQQYTTGNNAQLQQFGMDRERFAADASRLTTNAGLQDYSNRWQQQAYNQALQNYGTNWQDAYSRRSMPLNEMNALLSGQQVGMPQFPGFAQQGYVPGPDLLGAAGAQGAWDMNAWQQRVASTNANNAMLGDLLGTGMTAAAMFFSDKNLKKNIKKVGETPGGTNLYSWDWKKKAEPLVGDQPGVGVIAQENPDASFKTSSGYLMVDYSKIK